MYLPRTCSGGTVSGSQVVPGSENINWSVGMMGLGCGCGCGGKCGQGLGQAATFPNLYTPFEGGLNLSTWGWEEYGIAALLGYGLISAIMDVGSGAKRAGRGVAKGYRKTRAKARKHPVATGLGGTLLMAVLILGGIYLVYQQTSGGSAL